MENIGPAPILAVSAQPVVSPQRAAVLDRLRHLGGPVTVHELAGAAGGHANTVREHLDGLVELGLAVRERAPVHGRGRPAWRYRATPTQPEPPAVLREYSRLVGVLARQIARTSAAPREDALQAGLEWGGALAAEDRIGSSDGERRDGGGERRDGGGERRDGGVEESAAAIRRRLVLLLAEIGFAPVVEDEARSVRLPRCPFVTVAREHPEIICTVHLGVVRGFLQESGTTPDGVRLRPFAEPGACRLEFDA